MRLSRLSGAATIAAVISIGCSAAAGSPRQQTDTEWRFYGGDIGGSRYSPLSGINRSNIASLQVAWSYNTRESEPRFATTEETKLETTPLVVGGTMYVTTPIGRVIALDPSTGTERWVFDGRIDRTGDYGDFTNRGVAWWRDSRANASAPCATRVYIGTIDARLISIDAATGRACASFGTSGQVDLRRGLRIAPFEFPAYEVTSPPVVVGDLVITGSAIADNSTTAPASGEVRAFDARTGALLWTWDPIPRDSLDPAARSWAPGTTRRTGAANVWSVMAADPARDLIFAPTSSPAPDYYGGRRLGENRYANSVVALRASTGKVVWHFQTVHHDLWDYDNAAPPALVTVMRDGRARDVVLQATKSGQLFVLDRETGEPVFPVAERPVPRSDVPGEEANATQPFNTVLPPLSPQRVGPEDAWGLTDADRAECRAKLSELRNQGVFTPPSLRGTVALPSNIGGAHWGGLAFDSSRQLAIVPVNRFASMVQLIDTAGFSRRDAERESDRRGLDYEYNVMRGTPYAMRRRALVSSSGLPCTPPPWGALVAMDLRRGRIAWEVPLGRMNEKAPERSGSPQLGGPIVTAGGIVFIAAAFDSAFRAYDVETGRELWKAQLPAWGRATPMTYAMGGRQYVVIAAGGGGSHGKGDYIVAFALPR